MRRIQRSCHAQVPGWWVLTRLSPGQPHPIRTWMNRRPCCPIRHQAQDRETAGELQRGLRGAQDGPCPWMAVGNPYSRYQAGDCRARSDDR